MSWFFGNTEKNKEEDPISIFWLKDKTKYEIPSQEMFDQFKVIVMSQENDGWTNKLNEDKLKVWTKEASNSKINMLKVSVDFDVEASYFHEMIKDDYFFLKASTGDLFLDWNLVHQIDKNNIITYCKKSLLKNILVSFKSPFGIISGRDFLALKSYNAKDSEYVTLIRSVIMDDVPDKPGENIFG
jgi:hypothetical protein